MYLAQPTQALKRFDYRRILSFITCGSLLDLDVGLRAFQDLLHDLRRAYKSDDHDEDVLNWALVETAKFCLQQKLMPESSNAKEFLTVLRNALTRRFTHSDRIKNTVLLKFLQHLEKLIVDRISFASDRKNTVRLDDECEMFVDLNSGILQSWFLRNTQRIARLSFILGDPANCWRSMNSRLIFDFATRFQADSAPTSELLISIDAQHWRECLELFAVSARDLGDIDLLYGLQSIIKTANLVSGGELPLIGLIMSNLQHNYSATYDSYLQLKTKQSQPHQQCLIEFLKACLEVDKLTSHTGDIFLLTSQNLRHGYLTYLESKHSADLEEAKKKFDAINKWASSWVFDPRQRGTDSSVMPIEELNNLVVSTILNNAVRHQIPEDTPRLLPRFWDGINEVQTFLARELTMKNLVVLNHDQIFCQRQEVFHEFTAFLNQPLELPTNFKATANPLYYHSSYKDQFYQRLLRDNEYIRHSPNHNLKIGPFIDLRQHNATDFMLKRDNTEFAIKLGQDIMTKEPNDWIKHSTRLLLYDAGRAPSSLQDLVKDVNASKSMLNIMGIQLRGRIFRRLMKQIDPAVDNIIEQISVLLDKIYKQLPEGYSVENLPQETVTFAQHCKKIEDLYDWRPFPPDEASVQTLALMRKLVGAQTKNNQVLNLAFRLDTSLLAFSNERTRRQDHVIQTATRVLNTIRDNATKLDETSLASFSLSKFHERTIPHVWFRIKNSLISLITQEDQKIPEPWLTALINLVKKVAKEYPQTLIYEVIIQKLDIIEAISEENFFDIKAKVSDENQKRITDFWKELQRSIISSGDLTWIKRVNATEQFLKHIRKISYLPGEFIKNITTKTYKKLVQWFEAYKYEANMTNLLQLRDHFDSDRKPLKMILTYLENHKSNSTVYDSCICAEVAAPLAQLYHEYESISKRIDCEFLSSKIETELLTNNTEFGPLSTKIEPQIMSASEIQPVVKRIAELTETCRAKVAAIHTTFKNKLYMEQISPPLSRLEPDLVLMPEYFQIPLGNNKNTSIHKILQNVQLVHSINAPKKMTFIGSDGKSRSYLLKAHEDLRLDRLFMELFGSINLLLGGHKETREFCYRIQRFSVTPVGERSGLIEWVEAPSMLSIYKDWCKTHHARSVLAELYRSTCDDVCDDPREPDRDLHNCNLPKTIVTIDAFYQLLWSKIRQLASDTMSEHQKLPRPSVENCLKYRLQFPPRVFEEVVEKLVSITPRELLSHHIWFGCMDSKSYYYRTRNYIRSTATMSIVTYLLGIGDRHPDNILLDSKTGQVIHVDYNLCFEAGYFLRLPERVPFRLTPIMLHAFGFAGYEGGFRRSCERIMRVLRENRQTILHHLHTSNWSFMIDSKANKSRKFDQAAANEKLLCIQNKLHGNDARLWGKGGEGSSTTGSDIETEGVTTADPSFGGSPGRSSSGMGDRTQGLHLEAESEGVDLSEDLIELSDEVQTPEQQVTALLTVATSLENRAAMFEGWLSWV